MNVYAVVYRNEHKEDVSCVGVYKSYESATNKVNDMLKELYDSLKKNDMTITNIDILCESEWMVTYDGCYVDTCIINKLELKE